MTNESDARVQRNVATVRRFIDAWAARDADACMACLAPDIVYINQPLEPVVGKPGVRKIIEGILAVTKRVEWKLSNIFGHNGTVCTERLDCWDFDGKGWSVELPCVGMFDLDADGLIVGWRDYFDNETWFKNGGASLHV
jgi:limonene-1,2-epoxide hydrolase